MEVAHFVPADPATDGTYSAQQFVTRFQTLGPSRDVVNARFFLKDGKATVDNFQKEARNHLDALVFLGHSQLEAGEHSQSVGLRFASPNAEMPWYNEVLMPFPYDPLFSGGIQRNVERIETDAKVVFIGSCHLGPKFKQLWAINENTIGQALVTSPTPDTRLGVAAEAWILLLARLNNGEDLATAVASVNAEIAAQEAQGLFGPRRADGLAEYWEITGGVKDNVPGKAIVLRN